MNRIENLAVYPGSNRGAIAVGGKIIICKRQVVECLWDRFRDATPVNVSALERLVRMSNAHSK